MRPRVLTIAGVDPSGGAGVLADCATFHAHGVLAAAAVTAVTVQDATAVHGVQAVPPDIVAAQIAAAAPGGIDAAKTGMLVSAAHVEAIAEALEVETLVIDPVIASSSGTSLLDEPGVDALVRLLLPRASLLTPNIVEAERLSGRPVRSIEDAAEAAQAIAKLGPRAVVVTGGHLDGEPADVLFDGADVVVITGRRIRTQNLHGTGCVFSAAATAGLAKGLELEAAVRAAKAFVTGAIQNGTGGSVDPGWSRA